jgi:hypothetical protein
MWANLKGCAPRQMGKKKAKIAPNFNNRFMECYFYPTFYKELRNRNKIK